MCLFWRAHRAYCDAIINIDVQPLDWGLSRSRLPELNQATAAFVITASLVMTLFADRALAKEPLSPTLLSAIMVIMGSDLDSDGDGVSDLDDQFPEDASESADSDGDGVGDNADAFPTDGGETLDTDGDQIGTMQMPTMTVMASMMSMTRNPS